MKKQRVGIAVGFLAISAVVAPLGGSAWAGNNGYLVTYNSKVESGEVELVLRNDFILPSRFLREEEGFGKYLSHVLEFEYGVTDQFSTELYLVGFEDLKTHARDYTSFRWENRYRLFRQRRPLNPMVYVEYEDKSPHSRDKLEVAGWVRPPYQESKGEAGREREIESRVVLSEDFGSVDVAFNWVNETDIETGRTAFGYSAGLMWMIHHRGMKNAAPGQSLKRQAGEGCGCQTAMSGCRCGHCQSRGAQCPCGRTGEIGIGLEFYGGLGDSKAFGLNLSRQAHYFGPILMYHLSSRWMIHTQLAVGLSRVSDNLFRVNLGYEF